MWYNLDNNDNFDEDHILYPSAPMTPEERAVWEQEVQKSIAHENLRRSVLNRIRSLSIQEYDRITAKLRAELAAEDKAHKLDEFAIPTRFLVACGIDPSVASRFWDIGTKYFTYHSRAERAAEIRRQLRRTARYWRDLPEDYRAEAEERNKKLELELRELES